MAIVYWLRFRARVQRDSLHTRLSVRGGYGDVVRSGEAAEIEVAAAIGCAVGDGGPFVHQVFKPLAVGIEGPIQVDHACVGPAPLRACPESPHQDAVHIGIAERLAVQSFHLICALRRIGIHGVEFRNPDRQSQLPQTIEPRFDVLRIDRADKVPLDADAVDRCALG